MNKEIDFIRECIPADDLLLRLEYACFNMAVATSTLRRCIEDNDPVSEGQARESLMESIAEVSLWLRVLGADHADRAFCLRLTRTVHEKARGWAEKIKEIRRAQYDQGLRIE